MLFLLAISQFVKGTYNTPQLLKYEKRFGILFLHINDVINKNRNVTSEMRNSSTLCSSFVS